MIIIESKPINGDAKLCFIKNGMAYFTTNDLHKQWGDDWNDAPYEHNAGRPYAPYKDGESWEIIEIYYECCLETPEEKAGCNSQYSVEMINNKAIAWLSPNQFDKETKISILAGTTIMEFIKIIHSIGGSIWMKIDKVEDLKI